MPKFALLGLCVLLAYGCAHVSNKKQDEAKAYYEGGTQALVQGEYTDALERLLKAESLNPKDPYIQNNLALTYQVKKLYPKAEEHFKKALALKSDFPDAQNNMGALYLRMKKYDEAIKFCKLAAGDPLYKNPEKAYANIGRAYYKMKDYKTAISYQMKAVAADNNFCYAYASLGQAQMKAEDFNSASLSLKKAIDTCRTYEAPYYVLAMNYLKAKKKDAAIKELNTLIERFPKGKFYAKAKNILKIIKK